MEELYRTRQQKQINHLMKYYRYVFNDHFTMILFFAFGGFLYFYSQVLKEVPANMWGYFRFFLPILYTAILSFGKLATYFKEADEYYLLPKERQLPGYFKKAFWHSLGLPLLSILFVVAVSFPLLKGATQLSTLDLVSLVISLISLKGLAFLLEIFYNYQEKNVPVWAFYGIAFVSLFLSVFISFKILAILGLLACVFLYFKVFQEIDKKALQWKKVIEKESQRMKRIYGFISMFTDVPEMPTQVKRRRYLDGLLGKISKTQKETYTYLFLRRLFRGQEFSSLFLSLTTFTFVLFFIFQQFLGNLLAGVLFLYLLGFQLLPLYDSFDYMTLTQLYPLPKDVKKKNFQKVLLVALLSEGILFSVVNFFLLPFLSTLLLGGIFCVEIFLFCYIYAPKRLQRGNL